MSPDDVAAELRDEILRRTKITVSAGIAPNTKVAKIASNRNKPNGQFRVTNDRTAVMAFMRDLPIRKVNGIGRVFDRELEAVGIHTGGVFIYNLPSWRRFLVRKAFSF